jgi:uncharacterized damage-inducible protein DinB
MNDDLRYPIGKYEPQPYSKELKEKWLLDIQFLPQDIEHAVQQLDAYQLEIPYRDGGWTVKQLVHHVADSHTNAYIRFKLAITEDNPPIKTYEEKKWALLPDVEHLPINVSITLLHALHQRWYEAIKNLTDEEWQRTVYRPEQDVQQTIWHLLGLYAWHSRHHVKHITALKERMGW